MDIVIVGGGTAGWMTAAALSRFLGNGYRVRLVESDEIGTVGVGEATIPMIQRFNMALGLDEAQFLKATSGTYKLGIAFEGWGAPDARYIHGFGLVGRSWGLLSFHHYWLRARAAGKAKPLDAYLLNNLACDRNAFAHVTREEGSSLPPMPYAFHFDASLYAAFLRRYAEERGVVRHEGRIARVTRDGERGDVTALVLEDGSEIKGDFFIDCSGFRGLLIEEALGTGYEDWTHWLPCDRALAVPCAGVSPLTPYTRSIARSAGWQWRIPLQHRIGNGLVYCSSFMDDEAARDVLLANLDGEALADPRPIRFKTGKRKRIWNHNVIAVGLASGFMEPLESTSIHLVQAAIDRILKFLPGRAVSPAQVAEFNRQSDFEYERIRDFIILHYKTNGRHGEPFWDACRAMDIPDTLRAKIELFRDTALFHREHEELFTEEGWVQVMIGQNVIPERCHPIAEQMDEAEAVELLDIVGSAFARDAGRYPPHEAYVARMMQHAELETVK